jgi:hypothetical protein
MYLNELNYRITVPAETIGQTVPPRSAPNTLTRPVAILCTNSSQLRERAPSAASEQEEEFTEDQGECPALPAR